MNLAHLVPISLLSVIPRQQTTHLALSNLVLENDAYYRFYAKKMRQGHHVILDNPVHENEEVDPEDWLLAVSALQPSVTVIPDVIDDSDATVENAVKLARRVRESSPKTQLMVVPHGYSQDDWLACARALARIPDVTYFGISLERRLNNDAAALNRRARRLRMVTQEVGFDHLTVHLLGTSERGNEFAEPQRFCRATSCDSSKFAVFFLCNRKVEPSSSGYIATPYPGRGPFGGSMEYFDAKPTLPVFGRHLMRKNLALWCDFAARKVG